MGRIEDANRHVGQLNQCICRRLRRSQWPIDAKDQVTHGHIRRVQENLSVLARHMGVDDENLIKALNRFPLHDMGKIAVPEQILNKPGKLTARVRGNENPL